MVEQRFVLPGLVRGCCILLIKKGDLTEEWMTWKETGRWDVGKKKI